MANAKRSVMRVRKHCSSTPRRTCARPAASHGRRLRPALSVERRRPLFDERRYGFAMIRRLMRKRLITPPTFPAAYPAGMHAFAQQPLRQPDRMRRIGRDLVARCPGRSRADPRCRTTRETRFHSSACCASIICPVKVNSAARDKPMMRGSSHAPPSPGMMPSLTKLSAKRHPPTRCGCRTCRRDRVPRRSRRR